MNIYYHLRDWIQFVIVNGQEKELSKEDQIQGSCSERKNDNIEMIGQLNIGGAHL